MIARSSLIFENIIQIAGDKAARVIIVIDCITL